MSNSENRMSKVQDCKTIVRRRLTKLIGDLKDRATDRELETVVARPLGISPLPEADSKRQRLEHRIAELPEVELANVAERLWTKFPLPADTRNELQDVVWATQAWPEIPKRFRRDLARSFEVAGDFFERYQGFEALLDSLWILDDDPFGTFLGDARAGLRGEVAQHVLRNPGDWPSEYLFERLGAFECSDRRFALFLEGLASSDVLPDVDLQRRFVARVNGCFANCGLILQETGAEGGYPVFQLIPRNRTPKAAPKNLIFASSEKPDLRFLDAISNEIEIVSNAKEVLIYDRPITMDGLIWHDLQSWWAHKTGCIDSEQAKRTLYQRLLSCLPENSPPQRLLFESYHRHFGRRVPHLPALLPEVWLHWDPKTVLQRGRDALFRFRMDFLLLLPNNVRVVLEVDGQQHYADENGRASPSVYASMACADRELRLSGYEVYHFGAFELRGSPLHEGAVEFFEKLFAVHRVTDKKLSAGPTS